VASTCTNIESVPEQPLAASVTCTKYVPDAVGAMLVAAVLAENPVGLELHAYCNDEGTVFFKVNVQDVMLPTSVPAASTTRSCHAPFALPV